jgi:hypothetical protein
MVSGKRASIRNGRKSRETPEVGLTQEVEASKGDNEVDDRQEGGVVETEQRRERERRENDGWAKIRHLEQTQTENQE